MKNNDTSHKHFEACFKYLATSEGGKPYVPFMGSNTDYNYLGIYITELLVNHSVVTQT